MMNNSKEREGGPLFNEAMWIKHEDRPRQVTVTAERPDQAKIVDRSGQVLYEGQIELEKAVDEYGRPTRLVTFKNDEVRFIISESVLSAGGSTV